MEWAKCRAGGHIIFRLQGTQELHQGSLWLSPVLSGFVVRCGYIRGQRSCLGLQVNLRVASEESLKHGTCGNVMWRYNRRRRPDLGASPLGATYGRAPHNASGSRTRQHARACDALRSAWHVPEFTGLPQSPCPCRCPRRLEPGPLPSTGITRLRRYYGPLRLPMQPGLSLTGVRLIR